MWHMAESYGGVPVLGRGDGRKIQVGKLLYVSGTPRLCERGLHACYKLIHCLRYAKGTVICEVELIDIGERDEIKAVANYRKVNLMISEQVGRKLIIDYCLVMIDKFGFAGVLDFSARDLLKHEERDIENVLREHQNQGSEISRFVAGNLLYVLIANNRDISGISGGVINRLKDNAIIPLSISHQNTILESMFREASQK